jgi:hypothetical protein
MKIEKVLNFTFRYICGTGSYIYLTLIIFAAIFMSCGNELSEILMQEARGSRFVSISQSAGFFSPSKPMPEYNLNEATATSFQIPCNSLSISHHTNGRYIAGVSKTGSHNHWGVSTWLPSGTEQCCYRTV